MRTSSRLAAIAVAAALAGCPLPQPLPEYSASGVTPPQIVEESIRVNGAQAPSPVILVPANCTPELEPQYELSAMLEDSNNLEPVTARWFVNYDARYAEYNVVRSEETSVPPTTSDPLDITRTVAPWTFKPYQYFGPAGASGGGVPLPDPGVVRVVELVVSQNFAPSTTNFPNRAPVTGFKTQSHAWTFLSVPQSVAPCTP